MSSIWNDIARRLSTWFTAFEDVDVYDIEPMPAAGRIEKADIPDNDNGKIHTDAFGRWKVNEIIEGDGATFDYDKLKGKQDVKQRSPKIDGWDVAFLQQEFPKGFDMNFAQIMKVEWATVNEVGDYPTNQEITNRHTHGGITGDGFSLRNVKKYTGAFNDAERVRIEEQAND